MPGASGGAARPPADAHTAPGGRSGPDGLGGDPGTAQATDGTRSPHTSQGTRRTHTQTLRHPAAPSTRRRRSRLTRRRRSARDTAPRRRWRHQPGSSGRARFERSAAGGRPGLGRPARFKYQRPPSTEGWGPDGTPARRSPHRHRGYAGGSPAVPMTCDSRRAF